MNRKVRAVTKIDEQTEPVKPSEGGRAPDAPPRSGYERLERYRRRPEHTPARVLSRHGIGTPAIAEIEGRLLVSSQDEEHTRWVLERQHCEDVIEQLAGADGRSALLKYYGLHRECYERQKLALVKEVARFLLGHGRSDLWRLLYLHLRAGADASAVCDTMVNHFCVDGYVEHDELRFLWGSAWQEHLESHRESEEDNARTRREIDGEATPAAEVQP